MSESIKIIRKQDRRAKSFDQFMRDADVDRLLKVPPFNLIEPNKFPASNSLHNIILKDTRILRPQDGEVIYRQGEYGESSFVVLAGKVSEIWDVDPSTLKQDIREKKGIFEALKQLLTSHNTPEQRDVKKYHLAQDMAYTATGNKSDSVLYLDDVTQLKQDFGSRILPEGESFGHVSAMARSPRESTIISSGSTEVLEIKWQALRDIMKFSKEFRNTIEQAYRENLLAARLRSVELFEGISDAQLQALCNAATFESYGSSTWYSDLKSNRSLPKDEISEPTIVSHGDYTEDLILILGGFARVSSPYSAGVKTEGYKRAGDLFGAEDLFRSMRESGSVGYQHSLSAVGFTDIIRLPGPIVTSLVNLESFSDEIEVADAEPPSFVEFLVDNLFINGTQVMMINMDRCTECDDCVVACANAHDGNPRFVRSGPKTNNLMVAHACMHCADPVCMVGCPTGAIHRERGTGTIVINDQTCIGCSTCANNCPYDNIQIVNITGEGGELILDESHTPISKATKCDLCFNQRVTPACEYACPTNALKRIDPHDIPDIKSWLV